MAQDTQGSPEQFVAAINKTMDAINETLRKSGYGAPMHKDDEPHEDGLADQAAADQSGPAGDGGGAPPEMPPEAPAEGGAGEAPPAEGAPGEGGDMQGESRQAMEAELSQFNDDQLAMLMEAAQSEMEKRQAPPAEGAGAPPAAGGGEGMEMSMKKEFASLAKSTSDAVMAMTKAVSGLTQKVESLTKSQPARQAAPTTTQRAAAAGRKSPQVTVLHKSDGTQDSGKERLNKAETLKYLEGNLRSGANRHPAVGTDLIATVVATQSPEQLWEVQDAMKTSGVQLPTR